MAYSDSVTGSAAYPDATLPAPQNSVDVVDAVSHKALLQLIANKLEYLKNATAARTFWYVPTVSHDSNDRPLDCGQLVYSVSAYWLADRADVSNPNLTCWSHGAIAPTADYAIALFDVTRDCPVGLDIVSVGVVYDADLKGASHSNLPATMPKVGLWKRAISVGSASPGNWTACGTDASDASASVAAYNLSHLVEQTINETIATATQYAIAVTGETGTNAVTSSPCVTAFKMVIG